MNQASDRLTSVTLPDGSTRPVIAGGAAILPLAVTLAPLVIQEIPKLIQSLISIFDLVRQHPDTPQAVKAQMDAVLAHLDQAAAAVAAVRV